MNDEERLTNTELAILYRDGVGGLAANASRQAKLKTIQEWGADDEQREKFEYLRESPVDMHLIGVQITIEWGEGDPELRPFSEIEDIPDKMLVTTLKAICRELAEDVFEHYCEEVRRLQEESTLTKKQFLVYFLRWNNQSERIVADLLDMEIGTVRSHYARAKQKYEDAKNTVEVRDYCAVEDWTEFSNDAHRLLDPTASPRPTMGHTTHQCRTCDVRTEHFPDLGFWGCPTAATCLPGSSNVTTDQSRLLIHLSRTSS